MAGLDRLLTMSTAAAVLSILGFLYLVALVATWIAVRFAPEGRETEDGFEIVTRDG